MQVLKSALVVGVLATLLVACGGTTPPATQDPDGAGGATVDPGGGGGGNTGGGSGQIHLEVGGTKQDTVDLPFFGFGSRFSGPAGLNLNFTSDTAPGIATITEASGVTVISYASDAYTVQGTNCEQTNWNVGATSASGSFTCTEAFGTDPTSGALITGMTLTGNFTASQ